MGQISSIHLHFLYLKYQRITTNSPNAGIGFESLNSLINITTAITW